MVLSSSTSSRDHDATTPRRRLYTATSGGGDAAADGRTKTHVTHTKGKKRGRSSIGEKREVKMCRIFFPIIFEIF